MNLACKVNLCMYCCLFGGVVLEASKSVPQKVVFVGFYHFTYLIDLKRTID